MSRKLHGTIVSDKMDKTVVVSVTHLKEHPLYRKKYHATAKFKAHDPENAYKTGDLVEISEIRPLSKTKRWRVERRITATEAEQQG